MPSHEDSSGPGCAGDGVIRDSFVVPNCATQPGSVDWADQTLIMHPSAAALDNELSRMSNCCHPDTRILGRTAAEFGVVPRRERNQYKERYADGSALLDPKPLRSQGAPPKE